MSESVKVMHVPLAATGIEGPEISIGVWQSSGTLSLRVRATVFGGGCLWRRRP